MCNAPVFTKLETKLLDGKVELHDTVDKTVDDTTDPRKIHEIWKEAIRNRNSKLVSELCAKYDPALLIHDYILEKNPEAVKMLISSKHLNWNITFQSKTLTESAIDSNDDEIINIILNAQTTRPAKLLYPSLCEFYNV